MQQQMKTHEEEVNWVNFRKSFLEKYFPDNAIVDPNPLRRSYNAITVKEST